jgi:hypothetical protein
MVGIKPDGTAIPHLWLMSAYSLYHFNQHKAIFYGFLIIKRRNKVFDCAILWSSCFVHKPILQRDSSSVCRFMTSRLTAWACPAGFVNPARFSGIPKQGEEKANGLPRELFACTRNLVDHRSSADL